MEAFVIESPPIHENSVNYFSAELGFYRLGYYVERYKLNQIKELRITQETPVFGGIESIMSVFPSYVGLPYYPKTLDGFMSRTVENRAIEEVKAGEFFKPLVHQHKLFCPTVRDASFGCELTIGKIPKGTEVLVSKAINFRSEFRVYVSHGEILNICNYKGDPSMLPDVDRIKAMIRSYETSVASYGLDVGVLESGQTALVEVNDFCCLGNYGLKAVQYAKCIADRWSQIWAEYKE